MRTFKRYLTLIAVTMAGAITLPAATSVVASGLESPQKVIVGPLGILFVSEGGKGPNDGKISAITPTGVRVVLIEGLPGGFSGEDEVSGPSGLAFVDRTLFVSIGTGDAEARTETGSGPNPNGWSSPILSSVLAFTLQDIPAAVQSPIKLTLEDHFKLAYGETLQLKNGEGVGVEVQLVHDFRDFVPAPGIRFRASNPYALETRPRDPFTLLVADASMNQVIRLDLRTGRSRVIATLPPLPNPTPIGPPVIDVVPTSVRAYGSAFLVSYLSGFPFLKDYGGVYYLDPATGQATPFIANLSSATDVLVDPARNIFYTLEFSTNFTGTPPGPGRLMRYDSPQGVAIATDLAAPTGMALDINSGDIYVVEYGAGRVVKVTTGQ